MLKPAQTGNRSWMRHILVAGSLALVSRPALADVATLDSQLFPAPLSPSSSPQLEAASSLPTGKKFTKARISYLLTPGRLALPSPSPEGTSAASLDGQILGEFGMGGGLGKGWDLNFQLAATLGQWGQGLASLGSEIALETLAVRDARVSVGLTWFDGTGESSSQEPTAAARCYAIVSAPWGNESQFAGTGSLRAELGQATELTIGPLRAALDLALRLGPDVEWGGLGSGHFVRIASAAGMRLDDSILLGVQGSLLASLSESPAPEVGTPPFYLPAELGSFANYTWAERHSIGAQLSFGLPLSQPPGWGGDAPLGRAFGTPVLRSSIDYQLYF